MTNRPGIYKQGPNKWRVEHRWSDPKTGRRRKRQRTVSGTLEDAILAQAELRLNDSTNQRSTRMRFIDFGEQWLLSHKIHLAVSTRARYRNDVARAAGLLGDMWLDKIDSADVRSLLCQLTERNYAAQTVNSTLRTLRVMFRVAEQDALMAANPARAVRGLAEPKTQGRRAVSLSAEQLKRFVQTAVQLAHEGLLRPDDERLISLIALTGLRKGEALALQCDAVTSDHLKITRSLSHGILKSTKTGVERTFPILPSVRALLDDQRRWLIATQHPGLGSGLLFPSRRPGQEHNWFRSSSCLQKPLRMIWERGNLPELSCHALRRSVEGALRAGGVGDRMRRSLAGWSTESAQAVYTDIGNHEQRQAVEPILGPLGSARNLGC